MRLVFYFIYTILAALALAEWEIQIEGKDGWADKLPCWRKNEGWLVKLYGYPITGYHIFLISNLLLLIHLPVFFANAWTWQHELAILGFLLLMLTLEDFFWFLLNPSFGLKGFKKANPNLWWHKRWFLSLPVFYWFSLPAGIILILISF